MSSDLVLYSPVTLWPPQEFSHSLCLVSSFHKFYECTCGNFLCVCDPSNSSSQLWVLWSPKQCTGSILPPPVPVGIFGPGRRVPKHYCSCCCWNQFSKNPKTFLIHSATKLCIHIRAGIPDRSTVSDFLN